MVARSATQHQLYGRCTYLPAPANGAARNTDKHTSWLNALLHCNNICRRCCRSRPRSPVATRY